MSETDPQLLDRYAATGAEDAFAEIVRRHLNLVHSAALRQVRSPQLAEEVAQSVFTDLARDAHHLARGAVLAAWLYQVTRRTAIDTVRREARRQLREKIAAELNTMNAPDATWLEIEPLLDEAVCALDEPDRAAVLLRYFENKSLREVGQQLGMSDDAAQKRVSRAVERLREFFAKRGVTAGAGGLAAAIAANAVQAAPAGLAAAILTALAPLGTASASVAVGSAAVVGTVRGSFFQMANSKLAIGFATMAASVAALLWMQHVKQTRALSASSSPPAALESNQSTVPSSGQPADAATAEREPNPRDLLAAVIQARQQVVSGLVEAQSITVGGTGRRETNEYRLSILFDGSKLRAESWG